MQRHRVCGRFGLSPQDIYKIDEDSWLNYDDYDVMLTRLGAATKRSSLRADQPRPGQGSGAGREFKT